MKNKNVLIRILLLIALTIVGAIMNYVTWPTSSGADHESAGYRAFLVFLTACGSVIVFHESNLSGWRFFFAVCAGGFVFTLSGIGADLLRLYFPN